MRFVTTVIASFCILWASSAFSDPATQQKIIQLAEGVKYFADGDSISITEVVANSPDLKTGTRVTVKGQYTLSSKPQASLSLFATDTIGPGKSNILPEQRAAISKGKGEFELSITLEYDGYLHLTFYSVPDGEPFGGLYFGTTKQMEDIKHWDLRRQYTAESGTGGHHESQDARTTARYVACDNQAGGGFFWLDTTTGKVWWSDMTAKDKIDWKYFGQPQGAKPDKAGTYIPQANKSGSGLFILNTVTGEGWWTSGKEWKVLGKPE